LEVATVAASIFGKGITNEPIKVPREMERGNAYTRYPLKKVVNSPSVVAYARFPM
jgi:hypothetical protein